MPWEVSDNYIRSGHRSASSECRTITISKPQGIKAVYCNYGGKWAIASYLFSKTKWTLSKAKSWFSSHHERLHESINPKLFHYDFVRIYNTFVKHFGIAEGELKFKYFISSNELDTSKKYHPLVQFHESFNWVKPIIRYLRMDKEAKYYGISCITANISMNNRDYTPQMLETGTISMNYRPVNMNHDHSKWLPFPRTRIDWAKFEDNTVEGTLRVDNRDKWLQNKLDNGEILHPSIEGRPIPPEIGGGFHFTALALLEKGKMIPGDPLSSIQPLILSEQLYESLGKLVSNEDPIPINIESPQSNIEENKPKKINPSYEKEDVTPEGGEKEMSEEKITENHLIDNEQSDIGRNKMSTKTDETQESGLVRELNLKRIELETSNKLLQTEIDDVNKKYREYRRETAEKIADLELQIAKLGEKSSVVEGLEAQVGDNASKLITANQTIVKRDETIKNMKLDYEALDTLLAKKDKLIENYRKEVIEAEQAVKEARTKQTTAEANVKKIIIDKENAERRALEAESERNDYSEKYSEAFDMANKAIQEKNMILKKMHTVQEEIAAVKDQARKDGLALERYERDLKILKKKIVKTNEERREALAKNGVFEKNEDGTIDFGDTKLKI